MGYTPQGCKELNMTEATQAALSSQPRTIYWRHCPFPILYLQQLSQRLIGNVYLYSGSLYSVSLSLFMPVPWCFVCYCFVVFFEIRIYLQICLAIWVLLCFHMNSRLAFSSFLKNGIGILSRIACNLWITLGNMITLRVLFFPSVSAEYLFIYLRLPQLLSSMFCLNLQ